MQYLCFFLFFPTLIGAQNEKSSEQALKEYNSITAELEKSFPRDNFNPYLRESFTEKQLETYLSQYYKRLDLLLLVDKQYLFKMNCYLNAGNWFRKIGFPTESIKWYNVFFNFYNSNSDKINSREKEEIFDEVAFSYSCLANNYALVKKLDSAQLVYNKNIEFVNESNTIFHPSAYNNYGLFFYNYKKDLDSALLYYNKAYQITLKNFPNDLLLGSIRDNMADVYIDKNQPKKALPLYKANFDLYRQTSNDATNSSEFPRLISAATQQIETEIRLNQLTAASQTLHKLENVIDGLNFRKEINTKSKLEILKAQVSIYRAQKNYKKATEIALKQIALIDSSNARADIVEKRWQDEFNTISLNRVALNFKIDKIIAKNKINSQRSLLWIISILALLAVGLLMTLYFRRKGRIYLARNKQLLAEQNLYFTDLKNRKLESEIDSKKRDLSDFAISLTQNQAWAKELFEKIKQHKSSNSKDQAALLADLEVDINNKITVDSDTKEFYERLDKLSDSFYSELSHQFSKLSKNEIRLCSLIRLKMDSRSIATLQNISIASLNTSRYRLRKKLNLNEEIDLDDFIQNL